MSPQDGAAGLVVISDGDSGWNAEFDERFRDGGPVISAVIK